MKRDYDYESLEGKEERYPLKGDKPLPSEPLQCDDGTQRREFKGEWWMCCGHCALPDWIACCLSCNVPCLAFGWNQMRAFKMSWWKECAKYGIAMVLIYLAMEGARIITMRPFLELITSFPAGTGLSKMGNLPVDPSKLPQIDPSKVPGLDPSKLPQIDFSKVPGLDPSKLPQIDPSKLPQIDPSKVPGLDPSKLPGDPTKPAGLPTDPSSDMSAVPFKIPNPNDPSKPLIRDLTGTEVLGISCLYILAASVAAILALFLAHRRGMLRTRFNIRGTKCGDCMLWCFCPSCALCQETRTMMHNRVEEGVWLGPPRMHEMV